MYNFSKTTVRTSQISDAVPSLQETPGKIAAPESTDKVGLRSGLKE